MKKISSVFNYLLVLSLFVLQFIVMSLLYSCSSAKPLASSNWMPDMKLASDSIDGFCLIPDSKLLIKVYNNSTGVQIRLKITDKSTQHMLLQNGLTVWLDTTSKKKQKFGVVFPAAQPSMNGSMGGMGNAPKPGTADAGNPGKERKAFDMSSLIRDINSTGVVVKIGEIEYFADSKLMYASADQFNSLNYIITIPYSKYASLKLYGSNLSIGLVSEKEKKEAPKEGSEGGGGDMDGGGMGGSGGGGGGMGGGGGGMGGPGGGMGGGGMGGGGGGMGGHGGGMGGSHSDMKGLANSGVSSIKQWVVVSLPHN